MTEERALTAEDRAYVAGLQDAMKRRTGNTVWLKPFIGGTITTKRQPMPGTRTVTVNGRRINPAPIGVIPCDRDERGGFVMDLRDRCDA